MSDTCSTPVKNDRDVVTIKSESKDLNIRLRIQVGEILIDPRDIMSIEYRPRDVDQPFGPPLVKVNDLSGVRIVTHPASPFGVGDIAVEKSGSHAMTVEVVRRDGRVECAWEVDGERRRDTFNPDLLNFFSPKA